jgi:hypothetical protein
MSNRPGLAFKLVKVELDANAKLGENRCMKCITWAIAEMRKRQKADAFILSQQAET